MKSIAIIPLRRGSKGIPGKNKKKLLGRPLYQWVLGEAIKSDLDEVYVFSDDFEIKERIELDYQWAPKVKYWTRSVESATDTASTESGMLELAEGLNYEFDIICLLQATSPITEFSDINNVLQSVTSGASDSALTVVSAKRFIWSHDGKSINYDYLNRPRRQDFEGLLIENGAVYATNKQQYLKTKNRLGDKIATIEMPEESLTEIDEPSDWPIVEQLLVGRLLKRKKSGSKVKYLFLDVDGVFTEGNVLTGPEGEIAKSFSLRDGMGFEIAREIGLEIFVMTSENSPIVDRRIEKLRIKNYFKGVKDKYSLMQFLIGKLNISESEIGYVGDDINDLAAMLAASWSFAPANALDIVKQYADFVLHASGGNKAIREAIEIIQKLNNRI
ncbi:acylneuraminate cytidylyltransferase [Dyadobacter luticola]|uniref:N-acylneuraminate cytidylyltransferase n=1 Tax=Dyadobacter luticola TaxID=1979387 RepID=A0A5R9L1U4_9BACT|nr:acylneuraminate cytidylyltransferase [Dyadobacter luticola]TLV02391.1 acylneuraminate cytidylyltransferase [Dyadobacter luticola]